MPEIHVNNIGTAFRATIYDESSNIVNISGAITKQIIFTKPDRTVVTKNATLVTNGTDGKMEYVSASGDLNLPGVWQIQGYIDISSAQLYTNIQTFRVHDNLE